MRVRRFAFGCASGPFERRRGFRRAFPGQTNLESCATERRDQRINRSAVIDDDFFDNRQTKPRTVVLCRHIRIEEMIADLFRNARTIVVDIDDVRMRVGTHGDLNVAQVSAVVFPFGIAQRLRGILHDVDQDAVEHFPIDERRQWFVGNDEFQRDSSQEIRWLIVTLGRRKVLALVAHEFDEVCLAKLGLRQSGETGKLAHEPA